MRRCVIFSAVSVGQWAKSLVNSEDYIIACDAGYKNVEKLSFQPDLILGDFDSAPKPDTNALVLPTEKDDTDTHFAARIAAEKGFDEVLMLGALGGARPDHSIANLSTGLWLSKQGIHATILDEFSSVQYVLPMKPVKIAHDPTMYFSIFPMGGEAEGVNIHGAKYPLKNAKLFSDYPLGVSNETQQTTIISVTKGSLLLICTKKEYCREH